MYGSHLEEFLSITLNYLCSLFHDIPYGIPDMYNFLADNLVVSASDVTQITFY